METFLWIAGAVVAVGVLAATFRFFFPNPGDFGEALRYLLTPDSWSLFRGEYGEDFWASLKFNVWVLLGVGALLAVRFGVGNVLGIEG